MRLGLVLGAVLLGLLGLWFVAGRQDPAQDPLAGTGAERSQAVPIALDAPVAEAPMREAEVEVEVDVVEEPDERPRTLTAGINPAGGIVLEVVDHRAVPQAGISLGVELELWRLLGHDHEDKYQHQEVVTDAQGRAPIAASHPSEIEFVALHRAGRQDLIAPLPYRIFPGTRDIVRLVLPAQVELAGRVLDLAGQPVEGARVELDPIDVPDEQRGSAFVGEELDQESDAQGRFRFEVSDGWFRLGAADIGEASVEELTLHLGAEPPRVEVELRVASDTRIVRVDLELPAAVDRQLVWVGARASLAWPALEDPPQVVERAQEEHRAHARRIDEASWELRLAPGLGYTVRAGGPGLIEAEAPLPPDAELLRLALAGLPTAEVVDLRGSVRDAQGLAVSATVHFLREHDLGRFHDAQSDAQGEFVFRQALDAGAERAGYLIVDLGTRGSAALGPLALDRPRDDLLLVLAEPLAIEGQVLGLDPGRGAEIELGSHAARFARAELAPRPGLFPRPALDQDRTRCDSDGHFRFDGLAAGEYELWVEPDDGAQPPARRRVRAGERGLRIELGQGLAGEASFSVQVVDALDGRPIAGASVSLHAAEDRPRASGTRAVTGPDGRCELRGHAPGRGFVAVEAVDHARPVERYVDYPAGRHEVVVALSPRCEVEFEFVDAAGRPRANVEVCATAPDGVLLDLLDRYGHYDGSITRSNVAGRASLGGLPAGTLRVVVGWRSGRRVELQGGAELRDLANPAGLHVFEHRAAPGSPPPVRHVLP